MFYQLQKLLRKNIFFTCLGISSSILIIKILIIPDTLEFIEPVSIYTALLSSVIFIYGFIIAPAVSEFKESERIKSELKSVIENILLDIDHYSRLVPTLDPHSFYRTISDILFAVFGRIADGTKEKSTNDLIR